MNELESQGESGNVCPVLHGLNTSAAFSCPRLCYCFPQRLANTSKNKSSKGAFCYLPAPGPHNLPRLHPVSTLLGKQPQHGWARDICMPRVTAVLTTPLSPK
jgi:hypothetical protein